MQGLQWAALRCFSSTGEASAPEDYHWVMAMAGYKPVIEICGGTEIGGGFLAGSMLQPQSPSTFSTPTIGEQSQFHVCVQRSHCRATAGELRQAYGRHIPRDGGMKVTRMARPICLLT